MRTGHPSCTLFPALSAREVALSPWSQSLAVNFPCCLSPVLFSFIPLFLFPSIFLRSPSPSFSYFPEPFTLPPSFLQALPLSSPSSPFSSSSTSFPSFCLIDTRSGYVAQATTIKLLIFLPLPLMCWDCRCVPLSPIQGLFKYSLGRKDATHWRKRALYVRVATLNEEKLV